MYRDVSGGVGVRGTVVAVAVALSASFGTPHESRAQTPAAHRISGSQATYLGANIAIGAVAAGVHALLAHQPIAPALLGGAVGGAGMYAGMRLIGVRAPALRFAGLQTVAASASIARNMGQGDPWAREFTIPLYPVILNWKPAHADHESAVSARISAASVAAIAQFVSRPYWRLRPDWSTSLTAGTLVFRAAARRVPRNADASACTLANTCTERELLGYSADGVTFYAGEAQDPGRVIAHELVHVAQFTQEEILVGAPLSDWALSRIGGIGPAASRWVLLDFTRPVYGLNALIGRSGSSDRTSFLELEADAMQGLDTCGNPAFACRW